MDAPQAGAWGLGYGSLEGSVRGVWRARLRESGGLGGDGKYEQADEELMKEHCAPVVAGSPEWRGLCAGVSSREFCVQIVRDLKLAVRLRGGGMES